MPLFLHRGLVCLLIILIFKEAISPGDFGTADRWRCHKQCPGGKVMSSIAKFGLSYCASWQASSDIGTVSRSCDTIVLYLSWKQSRDRGGNENDNLLPVSGGGAIFLQVCTFASDVLRNTNFCCKRA